MPAKVQVIVEAKDSASNVLHGITSQFGSLSDMAFKAADKIVDGLKESVDTTMQYAESVRDLSLISGESAENTSRFIQVLDDYQLTAADAEAATKKLTANGLAPNIETLAQLSDQYLAINDVEERNKFILDNLGKSGLQWVNVLNQGSAALLEQGAAVSDSLILTQENVDAAEEYRLALDEWNDSVLALKVSIGNGLLPILTDLINTDFDKAMDRGAQATGVAGLAVQAFAEETNSATESYNAWAEALTASKSNIDTAAESTFNLKEGMSTLKDILKGDLGEAQDDFNAKMVEYNNQLALAKTQKEKDEINANIMAEKLAYDERATAIAFNIQQEAILNSQIPDPQKLEMITSLGQAYGMYDEATANAIMSTQGIIDQVENGNMTYETAMLYLRGMKSGMLEVGKASNDISEPVMHLGTLAENSAGQFGAFKESQSEMAQGLQSEAAPAIATVQSKWQGLNSQPHELDFTVNIHTVGSFPNYPTKDQGGYCFLEGTPITMADDTRKPIQNLVVGDVLRAYDFEHGSFVAFPVVNIFKRSASVYLNIDGLRVTREHPIWTGKGWTKAGDLKVGDTLFTDIAGQKPIREIVSMVGEVEVYNIEVEGVHNYFAGGVLVHNKEAEAFQVGGVVYAGNRMTMNERGSEPFFPRTDGRILGHAEAMNAMSQGGGSIGPFYGPVTLEITESNSGGLMSMR